MRRFSIFLSTFLSNVRLNLITWQTRARSRSILSSIMFVAILFGLHLTYSCLFFLTLSANQIILFLFLKIYIIILFFYLFIFLFIFFLSLKIKKDTECRLRRGEDLKKWWKYFIEMADQLGAGILPTQMWCSIRTVWMVSLGTKLLRKYSKPSDNGENNALCSSKAEKHFCWAFNKQQFRGNIKLSLTFRQGLHTSVSENFV